MILNLIQIGTDKCSIRNCSENKCLQIFILKNCKRWKPKNDLSLWQKIQWIFPWNLSRENLFKVLQLFVQLQSGLRVWYQYEFGRLFIRNNHALFLHVRMHVCVRERQRKTESTQMIKYGVIVIRCCNKMLNSDKQQVVHVLERDPYLSLQPRNQVPVESGKQAAWIRFRL